MQNIAFSVGNIVPLRSRFSSELGVLFPSDIIILVGVGLGIFEHLTKGKTPYVRNVFLASIA